MRVRVFMSKAEYEAWLRRVSNWHAWYAWRPTWVDGQLVWLEHLERQRWRGVHGGGWRRRWPLP